MNKLTLSVLALSALLGANAQANNTISFSGEVTEQTCQVDLSGNVNGPVVLLPLVSKTDLKDPGSVAGETPFTISVSGCAVNGSEALPIKTIFFGNDVTAKGNLKNFGSANNVELQILDAVGGNAIDVSAGAAASGLSVAAGESTGSHDFAVQYVSVAGNATAGTVIGSIQYQIAYK